MQTNEETLMKVGEKIIHILMYMSGGYCESIYKRQSVWSYCEIWPYE